MGEADAFSEADEARIASLAEQIAHHSHLYYNLAQPELSDAEFDRLWDELKALDPDHPQLSRVGADIAPGSVKVDHLFPMRSLDKATTSEELNHFVNVTTSGALQFLSQPNWTVQPSHLSTAWADSFERLPVEAVSGAKTSLAMHAKSPTSLTHCRCPWTFMFGERS